MSNLQPMKRLVEQLRVESQIQRIPVSESVQQMIAYIQNNSEEDHILRGIDKKMNPFVETSKCNIL